MTLVPGAAAEVKTAPLDKAPVPAMLTLYGGTHSRVGKRTIPQGHAQMPEGRGAQPGPSHSTGGVRTASIVQIEAPGAELLPPGQATQPPAVLSLPRRALYVPAAHGTHWPYTLRVAPASHTHCAADDAPGIARPPGMQGMHSPDMALYHAVGWQVKVKDTDAAVHPLLDQNVMLVTDVNTDGGEESLKAYTAFCVEGEFTSTMTHAP